VTEPLWDEDRPRVTGSYRVRVPAKINLHLAVGERRSDGYHELATVYHAIGVFDEVTARPADRLVLTMDGEGAGALALDRTNLVLRAAELLASSVGRPALARLHLRKQIPLAAGLAGGSADAAATLVALDAMWQLGVGRDQLALMAASLGSDVPFLVLGGTALGTGRGEVVSPVLAPGNVWHWVIAFAEGGLSTPEVYAELDRMRDAGLAPESVGTPDVLLAALRQRDAGVLGKAMGNDLEPAALSLRPELRETLAAGVKAGALGAMVSGSGPTCVFLCRDAAHAGAVALVLDDMEVCRSARVATGPVPGARMI
jgi:4-diphosphocytidyl-2-C-methyl-D-erythritol kinase